MLGQLAMYAGIVGCLLIVFVVIGSFVLLVRCVFREIRHRRSSKP